MDVSTLVATGVVTAVITWVMAFFFVLWYVPRLENRLKAKIPAAKEFVFALGGEFVETLLKQIEDDPDAFAERFKPLLGHLIKSQIGVDPSQPPKPMKFMGITIPGEVVMMLANKFLAGGANAAQNAAGKVVESLIGS